MKSLYGLVAASLIATRLVACGNGVPTISRGVRGPEALAFAKSGNLYVANVSNNTVTVLSSMKGLR